MQCETQMDGDIEGYLNDGDAFVDMTSQCVNTSLGQSLWATDTNVSLSRMYIFFRNNWENNLSLQTVAAFCSVLCLSVHTKAGIIYR